MDTHSGCGCAYLGPTPIHCEQGRIRCERAARALERWTGIVVITVSGKRTGDDVVFGEPGDLTLLGSRSLEGLNFRVEPVTKQLVDAGPAPAAVLVSA